MPLKTKLKLDRLSNYMRKFFDQMEIETFFTKKLKSESKLAFILTVITLFTFFILRRISLLIKLNYNNLALYAFYSVSAALMLYLLSLIYNKLKSVHNTLAVVLTNVDSSRNLKKCIKILNNLLLALLLLFSAMLFPFAMFALNLNIWTNMVPFALIIMTFYCIKNSVVLIDGSHYAPSYSASASAAKT